MSEITFHLRAPVRHQVRGRPGYSQRGLAEVTGQHDIVTTECGAPCTAYDGSRLSHMQPWTHDGNNSEVLAGTAMQPCGECYERGVQRKLAKYNSSVPRNPVGPQHIENPL